eukprot:PITA_32306
MKILSWNSRGLGHPSKIVALKDRIIHEKPKILLLQETKQGHQEMKGIIDTISQYWIKVTLESLIDNQRIVIYNIYAPIHYRDKEQCWTSLKTDIDEEGNSNIILGGDFNLTLHSNEKRGGCFSHDPCRTQLETITQDHDLVDVVPKNRRFTWNNRRLGKGNIMERLNRIWVNVTLLSSYSTAYVVVFSYSVSDHYPTTLVLETHCPLGPIPCKYSPLWSSFPSVEEIVKNTWSQHIKRSSGYIWENKLKMTKCALKEWEKNYYMEPEKDKTEIKNKLEKIHSITEERGLSQEYKALEGDLYFQLYRANRAEEQKWRIKSRQLWLQGGDKNSIFFHKQDTGRKIRKNVTSIIDAEGNLQTTQGAIRKAALDHYNALLTKMKEVEDYSHLLQHLPTEISKEINENLIKEIEEEEIRRATWTLHPDKSPGPNGFPICFLQAYWGIIKKYLVKMIKWTQHMGKIGGFTNATHLAFLPKENRPSSFSRFRPISLCNSSYKILTKILASHLKPLLPSLISENQGGFLANRQISDSILFVQEAIHFSQSRNAKGFILKLDLANAFDRVRHSFLLLVLKKMGFVAPFLDLVKACISGPWISPLINGRPGPSFQSSRGLRQGCPLSPYLFILMAESFNKALDSNRRVGLITGIKFGNGVKNINHSQFVDDTLLMGGAFNIIAHHFKALLDKYMSYSGGMVNHLKSCIYGWNTSTQVLHNIAGTFGVPCKIDWGHFTYLGMPVSVGPLKAKVWDTIIDKMKSKVQQWGSSWLNPAGHLVLLKTGLSSFPLYQFMLLQAPTNFHHKMEFILHHFLWQGRKNEKKKYNLINWKQVIQTQEHGGLGIRSPKLLNLAFGGKTVWRFISGQSTWWENVFEAKYIKSPR